MLVVLALVAGLLVTPSSSADPPPTMPGTPTAAAERAAPGSGTLVYIRGYDVYVARPDGTGERRLTTSGTRTNPWHSPSSADNGQVVAARGTTIVRMDQWGTALSVLDPPNLVDSAAEPIGGRVSHAVVSPDGSKIAYTYEHNTCPPDKPCRWRYATAITSSSAITSPSTYGRMFDDNPSWVTNSRLIVNGIGYDSIYVFDLGRGSRFWFNDAQASTDFHPLFEPAISRDGRFFAAIRGEDHESHLMLGEVRGEIRSGPVPTWPLYTCSTSAADGFASPSFAPDASALAFQGPEGVWVKPMPERCGESPSLVLPGALTPHWSAAPLQSTRPTYVFQQRSRPTVKAPRTPRPGVRLRATAGTWSPAPTGVSYQWLRNGRPIRGATKATYKAVKADRGRRISVRVEVRRAPYRPVKATTAAVKVPR